MVSDRITEAREALELVVKWERRETSWDTARARDLAKVAEVLRHLIEPPTDDEREALALLFARSMGGWNDDTTEPTLEGPHRTAMEAHWERVNAECLRQGFEYADLAFAARAVL